MAKIRVKQIKSVAGQSKHHRKVLWGLGLRGVGKMREHKDNNCIRGMINKVPHLVSYELIP